MNNIAYFIIFPPLISFFLLTFFKKKDLHFFNNVISVFGLLSSFIFCCYLNIQFYKNTSSEFLIYPIQNWTVLKSITYSNGFIIDKLSLSMTTMIISIGLLIQIFSLWYMKLKKNKYQFFAYTNFFITSMILLVLSNNLLLMFIGWEIVGVFSFLLIGFYNLKNENGIAAIKAFLITRISDVFLLFSIIILYTVFGTLNFELIEIKTAHFHNWSNENNIKISLSILFLLIGAIGKSAQTPLHIWLSEAMVGPTPVSALIHAATMVTSGVYLLIRIHSLLTLCTKTLLLIKVISIITILLSSFCALLETNIKKILAYSTISQLGYMFLAIGLQAWNASFAHLITHAIFKSLLFLSAGSIIQKCKEEKNIFKIAKFKKNYFILYLSFLIGSCSLVSFPFLTSGFYSKEMILSSVLTNNDQYYLLPFLLIGIFLTSIYTFRMFFTIFKFNQFFNAISMKNLNFLHNFPLIVLTLLSTFIGKVCIPNIYILNNNKYSNSNSFLYILAITSSFLCLSGITISFFIWGKKNNYLENISNSPIIKFSTNLYHTNFGFEKIYRFLLINLFYYISIALKKDPLSIFVKSVTTLVKITNIFLLKISNGNIRWYLFFILTGSTSSLFYTYQFVR